MTNLLYAYNSTHMLELNINSNKVYENAKHAHYTLEYI